MATSASSDAELLTEHFGYPPVSLLDDVINSINILAERALNSVEQGLLNLPPAALGFRPAAGGHSAKNKKQQQQQQQTSSDDKDDDGGDDHTTPEERARHEIENGTHQLETLLCASIDRNFDKFELYVLRNILTVRPEARDWIRLGHYERLNFDDPTAAAGGEGEDTQTGAGGGAPTVESVTRLRRRLQASQKLNLMLHEERARNAVLLAELRALAGFPASPAGSPRGGVKIEEQPEAAAPGGVTTTKTPAPFAFLRDRGDLAAGDANTPLTTTTAFALSQLQALRALSTSLRGITPDLVEGARGAGGTSADQETGGSGGSGAAGGPRKGWRRERLEYVEGSTRRHLENLRGLELGRQGEVRDGEWQGKGRDLGRGEVEGLENVVSMLVSGSGSGSGAGAGAGAREGAGEDAARRQKPSSSSSQGGLPPGISRGDEMDMS